MLPVIVALKKTEYEKFELQVYLPTGLMVMCSWLPFWVETSPGEQVAT